MATQEHEWNNKSGWYCDFKLQYDQVGWNRGNISSRPYVCAAGVGMGAICCADKKRSYHVHK
ncbi:hypothetical protein [Paenibacillus sp. CMAA1364]